MSIREHKSQAPKNVKVAIITVSTSRALKDDKSGQWMAKRSKKEGHSVVFHDVVTDEKEAIVQTMKDCIHMFTPHAVLITGGTGLSERDVTIEAIKPLFGKELTAFSILFAQLSFEEIDSTAIMSRATAGTIGKTAVFCMPGSLKACKLACRELIFPELGHIVKHLYTG